MLNHIGITIKDSSEIKNFYQDILGMEIIRQFAINKELSDQVFQINQETEVCLMQKDDLVFELFVIEKPISMQYNHICIDVLYRDNLIESAKSKNYSCVIIPRKNCDLVFIKDKSENIFEIKEKQEKKDEEV
jgi:catechol 2,3-dioxygenase-like lactoylglutathione lyase family enzyme